MRISSWRLILLVTTAVSLVAYPKAVSAATVTVTVAPNGMLVFSPSSVTIHRGDTVRWTWSQSFHSSTSGMPGAPNGIWNSGILNQGANFSHTFNSTGSFPYYCIPHGGCCGMVGMVTVVDSTPTPTPRPTATATPMPTATATPRPTATATPTPTPMLAVPYDFNGDGHPDYLLYNSGTRQTAIWYLNNNVYVTGAYGPTLSAGWQVVAAADFNSDGHPDYLLFNPSTRQTVIWYLNNNVLVTGAAGPTLPTGWSVVGATDFNGDGKPDYVLSNATSRQSAIWYMNNNVFISGVYGPTLPTGWSLVAP